MNLSTAIAYYSAQPSYMNIDTTLLGTGESCPADTVSDDTAINLDAMVGTIYIFAGVPKSCKHIIYL
jgi:hypothetical protein